jgi:hypothetical protein
MNAMNVPAFTAEASLYQTRNKYRFAGGDFRGDGNAVVPQDCGLFKEILCSAYVGAGIVFCAADCAIGVAAGPLGGFPCWACWSGLSATALLGCYDCLPGLVKEIIGPFMGGGSGGAVPALCCPNPNKPYCCPGGQRGCETLPDGKGQHCVGICVESAEVCHGPQ